MKEIKLQGGQIAFVDDEDYELVLSNGPWYLFLGYARNKKEGVKKAFMHVLISEEIGRDHADGNKLNNTKSNLRICSSSQNNMNKKLTVKNKSGFKGVHFHKPSKKWVTTIYKDGCVKFQRSFSDIQEAAHAYNKAAIKYHGEFAVLNPIGFDYK